MIQGLKINSIHLKIIESSFNDVAHIFGYTKGELDPESRDRYVVRLKPKQFTITALHELTEIDPLHIMAYFGRNRSTIYNAIRSVNSFMASDTRDRIRYAECKTIVRKYRDFYTNQNPYLDCLSDLMKDLNTHICMGKKIPGDFISRFQEYMHLYNSKTIEHADQSEEEETALGNSPDA